MREEQREFSDQNIVAKEAFRPEGSEQKAPRLLVVCVSEALGMKWKCSESLSLLVNYKGRT